LPAGGGEHARPGAIHARPGKKAMTTTTSQQDHDKFKLFSGKLEENGTLGALAEEVSAWAREAKVAPKSIGIEYVESEDQVIFSLGYRNDESPYGITLSSVSVGKLGFSAGEFAALEKAMSEAAARQGSLICHELVVSKAGNLLMVFMSRAA
jgi:hypothetical protein